MARKALELLAYAAAAIFLRVCFGQRFPEYDADCECWRWKLLDDLLQEP